MVVWLDIDVLVPIGYVLNNDLRKTKGSDEDVELKSLVLDFINKSSQPRYYQLEAMRLGRHLTYFPSVLSLPLCVY